MKTSQELLHERIGRLSTAVALGNPDRVPVVLAADAFCAKHVGVKLADFVSDVYRSSEIMVQSVTQLGEVDAVEYATTTAPILGGIWLANVKLPGRELGEDELWQVDEKPLMTPEDYDAIINTGYMPFWMEYLRNRLPVAAADVQRFLSTDFGKAAHNWINVGILPLAPVNTFIPFDVFCPGRGIAAFMRDLFKIPDKVQAAMDAAMPGILEGLRHQIRAVHPFSVYLGVARGASEFVSPKVWHRFVFPYIKQVVNTIVEEGAVAFLHFDSKWDRDLEFFRELPKGKCIFASDHFTDIYRLKKVLGDHMCIMGDVPPSLLALGTPDEVYNYSTKLIRDLGPSGFILAAGCQVPPNTKPENAKAMIAAATGK